MKKNIIELISLLPLLGVIVCSCSDSDLVDSAVTTKEDLSLNAEDLSTAVNVITKSKGFQIVSLDGEKMKGGVSPGMKVTLNHIKGEYVYQKNAEDLGHGILADFKKIKDASLFIMKMPKEVVNKPWRVAGDSESASEELENNFVVTTSKYNYEVSSSPMKLVYDLESAIEIDNADAGFLTVSRDLQDNTKKNYDAEYKFTKEYHVGTSLNINGDKANCEFNLKKGDETLYKESCEFSTGTNPVENKFVYTLMVRNIKIKLDGDRFIIFKDLKEDRNAEIEVIFPKADKEKKKMFLGKMGIGRAFMLCNARLDLKITFADKTVVVLSELLGAETLDKIQQIFSSMYDIYFAERIVDRVAKQIYYFNKYKV